MDFFPSSNVPSKSYSNSFTSTVNNQNINNINNVNLEFDFSLCHGCCLYWKR